MLHRNVTPACTARWRNQPAFSLFRLSSLSANAVLFWKAECSASAFLAVAGWAESHPASIRRYTARSPSLPYVQNGIALPPRSSLHARLETRQVAEAVQRSRESFPPDAQALRRTLERVQPPATPAPSHHLSAWQTDAYDPTPGKEDGRQLAPRLAKSWHPYRCRKHRSQAAPYRCCRAWQKERLFVALHHAPSTGKSGYP